MQDDLLIARFESQAEETLIVNAVRSWPRAAGSVAVASDEETKVLSSIAKRCGRKAKIVSVPELEPSLSRFFEEFMPLRAPDAAIVSKDLSPSLRNLARAFFREDTMPLEDLTSAELEKRKIKTAMVLWDADNTNLSVLTEGLTALSKAGCCVGYLPCFGTHSDRLMLMKALSFPDLPNNGSEEVISTILTGRGESGSFSENGRKTGDLLRSELDFLAIQGHGNPLDTFLSPQAILCSLAGGSETDHTAHPGLLHCFHGGSCFRKTGRWPDAELVAGSDLNALLIFAQICRYFQFEPGPFNGPNALAPQVMSGPAVAVISSPGPIWTDESFFILGMGMIREGRTFGEVSAQLRDLHDKHLGYETGLPPHIPSVAVFGSPIARLLPGALPNGTREQIDETRFCVKFNELGSIRDTVAKAPLLLSEISAKLAVRGLWQGARVKIARAPWDQDSFYLFLEGNHPKREVDIEVCVINQQKNLNFLEQFLMSLRFWPKFLDAIVENREKNDTTTNDFKDVILNVIRVERKIRNYLNESSANLDAELIRLANLDRRIMKQVFELQKVLLTTVSDIRGNGGFGEHALCGPLLTGKKLGITGRCACGRGQIRTQKFTSSSKHQDGVFKHACGCNDAGHDSAAIQASWVTAPQTARPGSEIELCLDVSPEAQSPAIIASTAVITSFSRDKVECGKFEFQNIASGENAAIKCAVHVPSNFEPGLCEISVLAIINGSLFLRCYLANVT